ncbi:MAG TPA: hypothetical protein VFX69_10095 [Steroidobacteraceae bacterium]|nr:hypothetical protein [Steroidobacteraceae bacterium]
MAFVKKRPCSVCRRWFQPDPRIGNRQRACGEDLCQSSRRQRKQAKWRAANPEYFVARRMQERAARTAVPDPLRMPSALARLPWDVAQSQFGVQGSDFIAHLAKVLAPSVQSQRRAEALDSS